ncbi:SdpI family protein [uncultured Brevundimonas sp.]|uniref:SdpI family protein n=1 Tax=uncultured Brevundimonas sp. TaxID=213418 RepID=UPI002630EDD7|nr:SdpI family protein [uncultured Brevundimonas sp.]
MKSMSLYDRLAFAVSLMILAGAAWVALKGPTTPIPMHFDFSGNVDRYGSRTELATVLGGLGVLNIFVALLTGHQARSATDPIRKKALANGQLMSVLIMAAVAVMVSWSSLGPTAAGGTINPSITSAFISGVSLLCGAMMGKVGPNPFIGVKTPWAYRSRLAWDKANRLAARLLFWFGLAGLIATPFAPQPQLLSIVVGAMLISAAWATFESWRVWRNDPEAQPF